ncbi:hypothetical protein Rsub_07039 [Raphidocelis subcapitata]|uniref:Serine/threonine-protein phosphatase 2A activator n=1 Tax=Raphidocelis subcapitata TaxID=307507 RepID=A0A2V0PBN5_9CHLO|nr:hypothetical protein Rsub_07039 [Raphidocelis subcapitata]|eukprot:GBF94505.1 hypothetical protein Rsub_07039 [Raphidocelis subcapitata]
MDTLTRDPPASASDAQAAAEGGKSDGGNPLENGDRGSTASGRTASAAAAGVRAPASAPAAAAPSPASAAATSPSARTDMPPPPTRAPWALPSISVGGAAASPLATSPSGGSAGSGSVRSVSPAAGSHFPQLARPLPGGAAITGDTHDTMSPTAAPWALGGAAPAAAAPRASAAPLRRPGGGGGGGAGRGAAPLVEAQPSMPRAAPPAAFEVPAKRISSEEDLKRFLEGGTAKDFVAFVLSLNQAVTGKALSTPVQLSRPLAALVSALDALRAWVDEIPPTQQSLRYGNPAYRTWFARMAAAAPGLMRDVLPPELHGAVVELTPYLVDSFGNATRIDYGTGHETTFAALLYCLAALGVVGDDDRVALVNVVFEKYLRLMRHIQTTYWLEPAGSHGVWGLDDYQFLPFVWGSAQLVSHPVLRPSSIHNADALEAFAGDYSYLGCVAFVKQVKKGPLFETSPMLNDVSGVPSWSKVNAGMLKMYQAEVLGKFPIMQHFLFGSILKWV